MPTFRGLTDYSDVTELGGTDRVMAEQQGGSPVGISPANLRDRKMYVVTDPQYGASGNGVDDDTAELQAAIDDAEANGGGIVGLPPGGYRHTGLVIDSPFVQLRGLGSHGLSESGDGVTLLYNATTGNHLTVSARDVLVSDIGFFQRGGVVPTAGDAIALLNGAHHFVLERFRIDNAWNGISATDADRPDIHKGTIRGIIGGYGIKLTGPTINLDNPQIYGVNVNALGDTSVTGLIIGQNVDSTYVEKSGFLQCAIGVHMTDEASGNPPSLAKFLAVAAESANGAAGWVIADADRFELLLCYAGINDNDGIWVQSSFAGVGFIDGGTITGNGEHGINVAGNGGSLRIVHNSIGGNGQNTSNTFHGVNVAAGVSNFQVLGNRSGGNVNNISPATQRNGITVQTGASDNYIIAHNDCTINQNAGVVDGGSGANKVVADNLS